MGMQINEAGADYQSARIHHSFSLEGSLADRRDLAGPNTHGPHSVQPTLRVDQPAVINRDIVGLRRLTTGNEQQQARSNECSGEPSHSKWSEIKRGHHRTL